MASLCLLTLCLKSFFPSSPQPSTLKQKHPLYFFFIFFLANYDPAEDEYYGQKSNGHVTTLDNNNQAITVQPSRIQRNISINRFGIFSPRFGTKANSKAISTLKKKSFIIFSAKIHEDDVRREIATANINLPPEILQVFSGSQIFHDHKPLRTKQLSPPPATFAIGTSKIEKSAKLEQINEEGSDKLLQRLEQQGNDDEF